MVLGKKMSQQVHNLGAYILPSSYGEHVHNIILDTKSKLPRLQGTRTYDMVGLKYIHKFFDTPHFKRQSRPLECGLDLVTCF